MGEPLAEEGKKYKKQHIKRDVGGRFLKGSCPNPKGFNRQNEHNVLKQRKLARNWVLEDSQKVYDKILELALGGNVKMLKLLWDCILPPIKQMNVEVEHKPIRGDILRVFEEVAQHNPRIMEIVEAEVEEVEPVNEYCAEEGTD